MPSTKSRQGAAIVLGLGMLLCFGPIVLVVETNNISDWWYNTPPSSVQQSKRVKAPRAETSAQIPPPGSGFSDCKNCPEMVVLPPGDFKMGTPDGEVVVDDHFSRWPETMAVSDERPQHTVSFSAPFAMSRFPVTKAEFAFFAKSTGYITSLGCIVYQPHDRHPYPLVLEANWNSPGFPQSDNDPVVCVNWEDAEAYVAWLNKFATPSTGGASGPYRLPSESEFEYAARGGTQTSRWWGSKLGTNNADCQVCGSQWDYHRTAPVGSFSPNPFGLYDTLGNVTQWTEDCWNKSYDNAPSDGDPWMSGNCTQRVGRGSNWASDQWVTRSATRFRFDPQQRINLTGFRLAKTLQ
jgi:formylglycine-generating enzyme required for sulfatase activity